MKYRLAMLLTAASLALAGMAHGAYINDRVLAPLYKKAAINGSPEQVLSSGAPISILRRKDDMIEVRTADGQRGWLESRYVTEEKPARSVVLSLQSENAELREQIATLKASSAQPPDCQAAADPAPPESNNEAPAPETPTIAAENGADSADTPGTELPGPPLWVYALAAALLLIVGAILGVGLMDRRQRRRHGGFRL